MKNLVSKVRAKNTKNREKQAGRISRWKVPLRENPIMGMFIGLALWVCTMLVLNAEMLAKHRSGLDELLPLAADGVFLFLGLLSAALFLTALGERIIHQNSQALMLALISLFAILPAKAIMYLSTRTHILTPEIVVFLLPMALAPMLATILTNPSIGVAIGVWTGLVMAVLAGRSFPVFLTAMVATVITAQVSRNVRTRTKVFKIGVIIGLSEMACVFSTAALLWRDIEVTAVLHGAALCLASGFFSAVVVLLILPLFETLFGITTDITLLELSDMGHPLLQKLALEAPGTYHHSLIVANLAHSAADEIGANALQARVCAYFHDVGKLTKPDFFAENIALHSNPHDDLPPSMSTLVITAHVKEGLSLAMLHKLPTPVLNVIREHHGTSLLSYFHHKARTQLEFELEKESRAASGQTKINDGDFRYEGPRPSSKESAIICLADAVEAASRSMEKTTPGHIEGLVNDIVGTRLEDGQLDQCQLTLAELTRVKRSFIFTLTNMLHGRVPYPKDENRDKQQTKPPQDKPAESKEPDPVPDEQSS